MRIIGTLPQDPRPWSERRDGALADTTMRTTIGLVTRRLHLARQHVYRDFPMGETDRLRSVKDKREAIKNLDTLLAEFRRSVEDHGGHTYLASRAGDAVDIVRTIAKTAGVRRVVKTKSMATEEIELNQGLIASGIEVVETDLGEYIIQRAGEKPSHILAPAAHKNRAAVQQLFQWDARNARMEPPESDDPAILTRYARERLRQEFLQADMGITGGNFLVAETGSVVIITNEGNADMVTSLPPILVSVVGVEKILTDWQSLMHIIQQPAMNGVGQRLSSYTTIVSGIRAKDGVEGPQAWHVVLVDNGRTALQNSRYEDVLSCIRCGACLNACPVFREIGGHAYGSVYSGPIGIVETSLLTDLRVLPELSSVACTMCHACADACPMDIDLPGHIVSLRKEKVERHRTAKGADLTYRWWARQWATAKGYRRTIRMARFGQRVYRKHGLLQSGPGLASGWFQTRTMPPVAGQTFGEWWSKTRGGEGNEHGGK